MSTTTSRMALMAPTPHKNASRSLDKGFPATGSLGGRKLWRSCELHTPEKGNQHGPCKCWFPVSRFPTSSPPSCKLFQGPPSTLGKVTWIRRNDGFWKLYPSVPKRRRFLPPNFDPRHPLSNACCPTATMTWCRTNTSCLWQRQITCRRWNQARGSWEFQV